MRRAALLVAVALAPLTTRAADLEQLAFLAGHWVGAEGRAEEVWLEPRAGTMPGSFRWVLADGRQILEYLVIAAEGDGVVLRFKHFDPDYEPWEEDEPNTYRLTEVTRTSATFERAGHAAPDAAAPRLLSYERDGDALTFRGIREAADAAPLVLEFTRRP